MLGFVDDKCLLSTSFTEMQDMLDVAAAVSRTQRSVYSLPKSVLIQFVGSHNSRRERIALTLKEIDARRACDCGRAGGDAAS
jgi:hypothetical protein